MNDGHNRQIESLCRQVREYEKRFEEQKGMRLSLRQSEARYRTVFEHTGTATFLMDEQSATISMVNSGFVELTGYTKKEVEGRVRLKDLLSVRDRKKLEYYLDQRRANRDSAPRELACQIRNRQGPRLDVLLKIDTYPDSTTSIGSMVDITRILQAERRIGEQDAQLTAILDAFEGQVYVCSGDFYLRYANNKQQITDYDLGKRCYEALHNRRSQCPFCVMDQIQAGHTVRFEVKNPRNQRWYYSMNAPIRHVDGSVSLLTMIIDIHERKLAEVALRERELTLRRENILLRSQIKMREKFGQIVGKSALMQEIYEHILNAASSDATVTIYGEPGTGKELVARAIHDMSERRNHRFVPVHCGAIPENLIESEFFGYKRGAFSGANTDQPGYIEYADGGTLFLDEVGEISPHMQVKLLRFIDGGGYTPLGSNQVKTSNIRIIAATNRDLKDHIKQKLMREDFFYRIHILPIHVPPLRDRKEDLPLLIDHFLGPYTGRRDLPPIAGKLMDKMVQYDWPGNVRELQNVVTRYCNQKRIELMGAMTTEQVPPEEPVIPEHLVPELNNSIGHYEKQVIIAALNKNQWHRKNAAQMLRIDRKTLFNKMKRYGLLKTSREPTRISQPE
jgi:PAS domain S-box-containing protein